MEAKPEAPLPAPDHFPAWHFVDLSVFENMARVMAWARAKGAGSKRLQKDGEDWRNYSWDEAYSHLLQHLARCRNEREEGRVARDPRSQELEMAHAAFGIMVLMYHERNRAAEEDARSRRFEDQLPPQPPRPESDVERLRKDPLMAARFPQERKGHV